MMTFRRYMVTSLLTGALPVALVLGCGTPNKDIIVLSVTREWKEEEPRECAEWHPTSDEVESAMMSSTELVNERMIHDAYCWLPCSVEGEVVYHGIRYDYEMNAAYHFRLRNVDTSFALGCESGDCYKYFVRTVAGKSFAPPCDPSYDE